MGPIDYARFSGLQDIDLEDSFILSVDEAFDRVTFGLDAVLLPTHPNYQDPKPEEQYCYRLGNLTFPEVREVTWLKRSSQPFTDANDEEDWGHIDEIDVDQDDRYLVTGEFGTISIKSSSPFFELDG
jgi:hypothetical protein